MLYHMCGGKKQAFLQDKLCHLKIWVFVPEILNGVKSQGYTEPTPIQRQAIPGIIEGRDILAGAQTRTGKTAAFTLPLLHILTTQDQLGGHHPRALVLTPRSG